MVPSVFTSLTTPQVEYPLYSVYYIIFTVLVSPFSFLSFIFDVNLWEILEGHEHFT